MTLEGLSVEGWLERHETFASPRPKHSSAAVQDGPRAARMPRVARVRTTLTWIVGLAVALPLALDALHRPSSCPPAGEGLHYCYLQHNVLRAVMTLLLVTAAVVLVGRIVFGLPGFVARVRRDGLWPTPPSAAVYGDPMLLAANRGHAG